MYKRLSLYLGLLFLCLFGTCQADTFEQQASYTVCFTPGADCTAAIVGAIDSAINAIWVQAYSFTSRPIAQALVQAKQRGVAVQIIFDKSVFDNGRSMLHLFTQNKIPVWVDKLPAIAHNKVMVIDQTQVITGSFNFTRAAQWLNAENVLIIHDATLAQKYLNNWQIRQAAAQLYKAHVYTTTEAVREDEHTNWWTALWHWLVNLFRPAP